LLIIVTIIATVLGLLARVKHFRNLAALHHFKAMHAGHPAAAIQRPVYPQWDWKFSAQTKIDRTTIAEASPLWQASQYHAELRDIYFDTASQPWLPLRKMPAFPSSVVLPSRNELAAQWWNESFGTYIENNQAYSILTWAFPRMMIRI
jgi:hypothetical protein